MTNENEPYHLPRPDMEVFGPDQPPPDEGERPGPEQGEPPAGPGPSRRRGETHQQSRATTRPRERGLGEQRARARLAEEQAEQERAERALVERKAQVRHRVMIGAGVTVGVAGLVGAWYLLASPSTVTARCTVADGGQPNVVVDDQYCDSTYATSHGGYVHNGFIFLPIVGGGYRQYHYYYGGTGTVGHVATGGSFSAPSNTTVKTGSGHTIQRGGFGLSGKSGHIGGKSGGG